MIVSTVYHIKAKPPTETQIVVQRLPLIATAVCLSLQQPTSMISMKCRDQSSRTRGPRRPAGSDAMRMASGRSLSRVRSSMSRSTYCRSRLPKWNSGVFSTIATAIPCYPRAQKP